MHKSVAATTNPRNASSFFVSVGCGEPGNLSLEQRKFHAANAGRFSRAKHIGH